ncbi:MAG: YHS domain-containing protein [Ignavibacteria bacterium]|nr:YHS domain-containing protein [Ignavibacteria bacterium]
MFTEYNGKKYYFCCEKCQRLFSKNPHKYINKN